MTVNPRDQLFLVIVSYFQLFLQRETIAIFVLILWLPQPHRFAAPVGNFLTPGRRRRRVAGAPGAKVAVPRRRNRRPRSRNLRPPGEIVTCQTSLPP